MVHGAKEKGLTRERQPLFHLCTGTDPDAISIDACVNTILYSSNGTGGSIPNCYRGTRKAPCPTYRRRGARA